MEGGAGPGRPEEQGHGGRLVTGQPPEGHQHSRALGGQGQASLQQGTPHLHPPQGRRQQPLHHGAPAPAPPPAPLPTPPPPPPSPGSPSPLPPSPSTPCSPPPLLLHQHPRLPHPARPVQVLQAEFGVLQFVRGLGVGDCGGEGGEEEVGVGGGEGGLGGEEAHQGGAGLLVHLGVTPAGADAGAGAGADAGGGGGGGDGDGC